MMYNIVSPKQTRRDSNTIGKPIFYFSDHYHYYCPLLFFDTIVLRSSQSVYKYRRSIYAYIPIYIIHIIYYIEREIRSGRERKNHHVPNKP